MDFLALDVETANEDYSSICQIGIATFKNGKITDQFVSLINPEDDFNPFNITIHNITADMTKGSPTFKDIYPTLKSKIENTIVIHHMPFDWIAVNRACEKYNLPEINVKWLDSAKIARRTWEKYEKKGYGLSKISSDLGIEFKHHDALEDAIAAGKVVVAAIKETGISLDEWIEKVKTKIHPNYGPVIKFDGNPEGSLFGETLVFTGVLSLSRKDTAKLAADAGCNVKDAVTKDVTMLVVGLQDELRVGDSGKSIKQIKAEKMIHSGQHIVILSEDDFKRMVIS